MTTNFNLNEYFAMAPQRYEFKAYQNFLTDVAPVILKNAIHITGTNGKGSTARYIANTLENDGYKVGLFLSPHFLRVNELATINGVEISDDFIISQIYQYDTLFKKHELSTFEMMTFISFQYFLAHDVDFTVVEVGMGGLNDATNIFTPLLSIITNVGLDHKVELGPTLADIAKHKAGIIKQGIPVIVGPMAASAHNVIMHDAKEKRAPVINFAPHFEVITRDFTKTVFQSNGETYELASGAKYEIINALCALTAIKYLQEKEFKVTLKSFKQALLTTPMAGRYTVAKAKPLVIIDGAHNPHALQALINDVLTRTAKIKVIYSTFKDKQYESALDLFSLTNAEVTLTTFTHPRALTEFKNSAYPFFADHEVAIKHVLAHLKPKDLLLVVGSLYFATLVAREFSEGLYD